MAKAKVFVERQRVLITVKTYPTLSTKYGETVCTAGVRPDGSWVRIYPVPFRRLGEREQYSKYDWIECTLARNPSDPRPETFRPVDERELVSVGRIDTADYWRERRRLILETARVYDRLEPLLASAKGNTMSLAVFKPARIVDFFWEAEEETEWNPDRVRAMREQTQQHDLFSDNAWRETFELIPKLPWKFYYRYVDADGRESTMRVLDWEVGQLYWNCYRRGGSAESALAKVRRKYFDDFLRTDLHLFLGTTQQWHGFAPNPWLVVGVFYPPCPPEAKPDEPDKQLGLFAR